jgi:Copper chaperone
MKFLTLLATLAIFTFATPAFAKQKGDAMVAVNGLVCDFCARALEKTFGKKDEVETINVDLNEKIVTIHFHEGRTLDDETLTQIITDSGYNVEGIARVK